MSGALPTSPAASTGKLRSLQPTRVSVSHSLKRSTRTTGAQRWLVDLTWNGLTRAQVKPLEAFVIGQQGQAGTFTVILPGHEAPAGVGTGTPLVKGAGQTGRAVTIDGWTPSITGILKAGDLIKFSGHTKVYMVTADASSNGSGDTTVAIEPALMAAIADNEAVIVSNVPITVSMAGDLVESIFQPPLLYDYTLSAVEAF